MSSFIVSNKHFSTLEYHLKELINNSRFNTYRLKKYGLYDLSRKEVSLAVKNRMDKLKELNVLCVSLQYKDHYKNTLDKEIEVNLKALKTNVKPNYVDDVTFYNGLKCLNYQIEINYIDGIRDDLKIEYDFLNDLIDAVANYIVSKIENNTWSID